MTRRKTRFVRKFLLAACCLFSVEFGMLLAAEAAGPTGGSVVRGQATITTPDSSTTLITQTSQKAVINWQDFSVPTGTSTIFDQPNTSSITLNRVTGTGQSFIDGNLLANGHIWLINGNGILFGKNAQVNVGSLLATTADIRDDDFMNGKYDFSTPGNPNAVVENRGSLHAASGGSIVLGGPVVENSGLIEADLGTVVLGGAQAFTVDFQGDKLIQFAITTPVSQTPTDASGAPQKALVSNSGTISAAGGKILLTARAAENVANNVINNTGVVEATSVHNVNGTIVFDAGPDGEADVGGTVDASGKAAGETGGTVQVTANTVKVADGTTIDASGDAGGGTVDIGGEAHGGGTLAHAQNVDVGQATIKADAINSGNGGKVVVWSDGATRVAANISAKGGASGGNGGFVETSGHNLNVADSARITTYAPAGETGTWLLDPTAVVIENSGVGGIGGSDIAPATIACALGDGSGCGPGTNVVISAATTITVYDPIFYSSSNSLSLLAGSDIYLYAGIQNSGAGDIYLVAGWDGTTMDVAHLADAGVYGNNSGSITIGGASAVGDVSVGSYGGTTYALTDNLSIDAESGYAQIGYFGGGAGNIDVEALGNVSLTVGSGASCSNSSTASCYFAQIGNGGVFTPGDAGGGIAVHAGGGVTLSAGSDVYSYAQIGNGGDSSTGTYTGNIDVTAGKDIALSGAGDYAQIGNGGWGVSGASSGDVTVKADGDITLTGFTTDISYDRYGYAQIGNGGQSSNGDASGNLDVESAGTLTLQGGSYDNYAQIGNGGEYAGANSQTATTTGGDITVVANDISLFGGNSTNAYAQIGNGGAFSTGEQGGDISVTSTNSITLSAGDGIDAYTQIGNGSIGGVYGNVSGNIDIEAGGSVNIFSCIDCGSPSVDWIGNFTYGDGGYVESGNVTVVAADVNDNCQNLTCNNSFSDIVLADLGSTAIAGSGGDVTVALTAPNDGNSTSLSINDQLSYDSPHDLTIISATSIGVTGGSIQNAGTGNISLIAGWNTQAVTAQDIFATANGGQTTVAQLFLDTANSYGQTNNADPYQGSILVGCTAGDQSCSGSSRVGTAGGTTTVLTDALYVEANNGVAQLGYYGAATGDIAVYADGDVSVIADNGYLARIGNGGADVSGSIGGDISITMAGGTLLVSTPGDGSLAQIGNLGSAYASESGDIAIDTGGGDLNILSEGANSNAFIGNGSSAVGQGTISGNIDVTASDVSIQASGDNSQSWIGNDVRFKTSGDVSGDITLTADSLTMTADGNGSQTRITNRGNGSVSGDIKLYIAGDILMEALDYGLAAVGLGEGGSGTTSGNIIVDSGGAITLDGSGSSVARISNGAATDSDITITAVDDITLTAEDSNSGAVIGNLANGDVGGNIKVESTDGSITLTATGDGANATIGHIAFSTDSNVSGDISVIAAGDISLSSTGTSSIANIGDTGQMASATGDIDVHAGGNISVTSSGSSSLAAIGNGYLSGLVEGGQTIAGNVSGAVSLTTDGGDITVESSGTGTVANVGNMGGDAISGGVTIDTSGGDLSVMADGSGSNTVAQVGALDDTNTTSVSGDTDITVNTLTLASSSGHARIGNGSQAGSSTGAVTIAATKIVNDATSDVVGDSLVITSGASTGNAVGSSGTPLRIAVNSLSVATNGASAYLASPTQGLSIGVSGTGIDVGGGTFGLSAGGAIDQTDAILAATLDVSNTSGDITFTRSDNQFGTIAVSAAGMATIYDTGNLTVASANAGSDLTLLTTGNLAIISSVQLSNGSILAVAGWDGTTTDQASLITGSAYGNNGGSLTIGGAGASGDAALGSANGSTTVAGDNVTLAATNGYAQVGYHGAASGDIAVVAQNAVDLQGGSSAGEYAQIGHGGYQTTGSDSGAITISAGGDVTLSGGTGQNGYAQIGHGGAQANASSTGYSYTGDVTFQAADLILAAGSGSGSYAQLGHGGFDAGHGLTGTSTIGGNITVTVAHDVSLTGNGNDAYAQIGNGGDQINAFATASSSGTISGDITVTAPNAPDGSVTMTSGAGSNAYSQIGNGGYGANAFGSAISSNFQISGTIVVTDLALTGGTGGNAYSQIGNGDASHHSIADIFGDIFINAGTGGIDVNDGSGAGADAHIGNATGQGTVSGNITCSEDGCGEGISESDPNYTGTIATLTGDIPPPPPPPTTLPGTDIFGNPDTGSTGDTGGEGSQAGPLEDLSGGDGSETSADAAADSVGNSLDRPQQTSRSLIAGLLTEVVNGKSKPHGVPPADENYSSWGNEGLWQ